MSCLRCNLSSGSQGPFVPISQHFLAMWTPASGLQYTCRPSAGHPPEFSSHCGMLLRSTNHCPFGQGPYFWNQMTQTFFPFFVLISWAKYLRILRIAFLLLNGVNDPEVRLFFGRFQRQTVAKSLVLWSVVQLHVFRTVFGWTDLDALAFEECFIGRLAGSFAL
jgi:hypothetical protein